MSSKPSNLINEAMKVQQVTRPADLQVIAVTAGKGGVGKTNVSVNLAIALAKQGKRVLLLDADLGLANIDVLLGVHTQYNLSHVIQGQCSLRDIIIKGPFNIQIIPSSSGVESMTKLTPLEHSGLISAFNDLSQEIDVLVIDTAAGISETVISFTRSAQEIILVVCDEPTSITDAYAMMKVLSKDYGVERFHVLANMVDKTQDGNNLFAKLLRVTDQFLQVKIDYIGAVINDEYLRKAVKQQKAVLEAFPSCRSSCDFVKLAKRVSDWPVSNEIARNTPFFLERLIQQPSQVR